MKSIPMKGRKPQIGKKGGFRGWLTFTRWSNAVAHFGDVYQGEKWIDEITASSPKQAVDDGGMPFDLTDGA
ncbi:hypothetical protein [Pseudomonas syringae group sp. J309-1]|uniref:hypothetical protein n=1 Tax=Pseudomonas syringae group sp. J309-1 TaxID=3079588 RepID=UPI002906CC85|nr:hypothetical protein [Pseudomonas syringae group sp. J309-1]MDU8358434.1 hypothetical protein [Pseudomonas syringae group sp. J309-1]